MFDDLGDGGVGLTATGVLIGFIGYVTRGVIHNDSVFKILLPIAIVLAVIGIVLYAIDYKLYGAIKYAKKQSKKKKKDTKEEEGNGDTE